MVYIGTNDCKLWWHYLGRWCCTGIPSGCRGEAFWTKGREKHLNTFAAELWMSESRRPSYKQAGFT